MYYVCRMYCGLLVVILNERIICEIIKMNLWCYFTLYVIGCQMRVLIWEIVVGGNLKDSNVGLAAGKIFTEL